MITEFSAALNQVANDRGISVDSVVTAIQEALIAAYKRDFLEKEDETTDISASINLETGEMKILKGDKDITPAGFGRIAAQAASQVLLQKIRKTEYDSVVEEYREKLGTLVSCTVFRAEPHLVVLDLGKVQGIMPAREQIEGETYRAGSRISVLIKEVKENPHGGAEIIVSRSDKSFIRALFAEEVPEIVSGVVKVESISRDPGSRSKVAVSSNDKNVDPVGACVGHKGVRVQSILSEISPEKIDIIPFNTNISEYIASALSPAKVSSVSIDEKERKAEVRVPEDQQSLAIGKGGQNVRLAHLLTGWKIDIAGVEDLVKAGSKIEAKEDFKNTSKPRQRKTTNLASLNLEKSIEKALKKAGISSLEELKELDRKDLLAIDGIGSRSAEKVLKTVSIY